MTAQTQSEITAGARDLIDSIPGCHLGHAALGALGVSIRLTGWTASLHKGGFAMNIQPPGGPDDADSLGRLLEPVVATMARRRAAAMALGHDGGALLPYRELSHLRAEAIVLAAEPDLRSVVPALVSRQLQANAHPTQDGFADAAGAKSSVRISAPAGEDPHPYVHSLATRSWGTFDGTTITLQRLLPETVVGLLPGRAVGELLDPSLLRGGLAPLSARVIVDACIVGRCTSITVRPEWRAFQ